MKDFYNIIVVGAGPAGSSAALTAARNNLSVALIERGKYPGSKNMFGGVIYSKATSTLIPAFWEKAPVERPITKDQLWFLEPDSAVQIGFHGRKFAKPPYNKFTVIRSRFDRWFARQAEKAGADLQTSTTVTDITFEKKGLMGKKATGVILEDGKNIKCDLVIIAEGVVGNLVKKAGLNQNKTIDTEAIYVKEILSLPASSIEEKFNLSENEGANMAVVGFPASGAVGKGGIWTNKNSISIGVGCILNQIINKEFNPYQLLQNFKKHPFIKSLLKNAEVKEYQSKIIPKGEKEDMPQLYDNGILVTGDAMMMVGGEGTVLAMLSGKYAAETAIKAHAQQKFDKKTLSNYENKINNLYITKDNKAKLGTKNYTKNFSDSDHILSRVINKSAYKLSTFNMETSNQKVKNVYKEIKTLQSFPKTLKDIVYGLKYWRVL